METKLPFEVPPFLVSRRSSNFKNMELHFPDRDVAVFEPTKAVRLFYVVFFFAGIIDCAIAAGIARFLNSSANLHGRGVEKYLPVIVPMAMIIGGVVLVFIAVAGLKGKLGTRKIIFDRRQKIVIKEARKVEPLFEGGLRLKDVAALQVCTGKIGGSKGSYTTFELNLVLNKPAGERISLVNHSKGISLLEDARQLAEFLKLPLLDCR
ncbi:MAG: hypothetical protein L0Y36_06980 [Planctomycetales bacterium]|nr:hypothetical protein [Planctomycetales bacterium]